MAATTTTAATEHAEAKRAARPMVEKYSLSPTTGTAATGARYGFAGGPAQKPGFMMSGPPLLFPCAGAVEACFGAAAPPRGALPPGPGRPAAARADADAEADGAADAEA